MPIYTNLCISRTDVRKAVAGEVTEFALTHQNIDEVLTARSVFSSCKLFTSCAPRSGNWLAPSAFGDGCSFLSCS